jgi:hypothetical protein
MIVDVLPLSCRSRFSKVIINTSEDGIGEIDVTPIIASLILPYRGGLA